MEFISTFHAELRPEFARVAVAGSPRKEFTGAALEARPRYVHAVRVTVYGIRFGRINSQGATYITS
jgi:hypothetical protein